MRQLQLAWQTYSEDNADYLALNQTAPVPNKGGAVPNRLSGESWVAGNPLYDLSTTNIERGSLFQYTRSTAIYRCPMDDSTVSGHPDTLRTRSYSMDAYLGGDPDLARPPKLRSTELANQSANVFVFIEEDETDGFGKSSSFLVLPRTPVPTAWFSKPARRHSGGCNITFADGHIEYWHWRGQKDTTAQISMSSLRDDPDMHRLQNWLPQ